MSMGQGLEKIRQNIEKIMLVILVTIPFTVYLNPFLEPGYSRIMLIILFYIPFIFILYYRRHPSSKVLFFLCLLIIPTTVFITRNYLRFNALLEGAEISDTRTLAQMYLQNGELVFPDSHSYFPQTGLVIYFLSIFCEFSLVQSSVVAIALYIALLALVGFYAVKIVSDKPRLGSTWLMSVIAIASVFVSNNILYTNVTYRSLASPIFMLLLFFMYHRYYSEEPKREYTLIAILLSLGITLGDPTSALIMIPFFLLISYLGERKIDFLYALIPASWFTYSATSYLLSIRRYSRFAISGFLEFLHEIIQLQFPERVVPWRRTISLSIWDAYLTSAGFLSLLLVSTIVGLYYLLHWVRKDDSTDTSGKNLFANTVGVTLLSMAAVAGITYVGASVQAEVTFSDIRTIAMLFVSSLLAFSFIPRIFTQYIGDKDKFRLILTLLLLLTSLRQVYGVYPKSLYDPPQVVEDIRLGSSSIYVYAEFHNQYYRSGGLVTDWKTHNRIQEAIQVTNYERRWLNATTLEYPFASSPQKSIIVFNTAGLTVPSIYHPLEAYQAAYNYSLSHNRIYDNGVLVATRVGN